jgi:hypothetical protein
VCVGMKDSHKDRVQGSCEYSNESSGSAKGLTFID